MLVLHNTDLALCMIPMPFEDSNSSYVKTHINNVQLIVIHK